MTLNISLKLKETDLVANSISSMKNTFRKRGKDVNGLWYKKSTQIEVTSSRETLVNSEVISKDTMNWESTQGRSRWIMEEKSKMNRPHKILNKNAKIGSSSWINHFANECLNGMTYGQNRSQRDTRFMNFR